MRGNNKLSLNIININREIMKVKNGMVLLGIGLLLVTLSAQKQIFIDYGVGGQGRELMKYFFDVENSFYVDVGAYDPIFASNTLNLYTMGWGGINIDASPERLARFFMQRPDQTNLNFAIGDSDTYVTLYEVDQDSSSTVSPKVKDYIQSFKPVVQEIKIPSLSLKQVCERYYYRKPIFMNLDIEGYGSQALLSNDWSNPLCVPEVIFSQINEETRQSGLPLPEQILKKYGYIKQPLVVGLNEIYLHETVMAKYQQKAKRAEEFINKIQYQSINSISFSLARHLNTSTQLFKHYQPTTDRMFHKFAKVNQVIDLNHLNQVSNQLSPALLDRPIGIYHFHPLRNTLVVSEGKFTTKNIGVQNYQFLEVEVEKPNGKKFYAYVLDHYYQNASGKKPSILSSAQNAYVLEAQKQYTPTAPVIPVQNLTEDQKEQQKLIQNLLLQVTKQLNNQENLLQKIDGNSYRQTKELKDTFISQYNIEINILQQISTIVANLREKSMEDALPTAKQSIKILDGLNLDIGNLMIIQNITLALIVVMSVSLCVSVCVLKRKKNRKYSSIGEIGVSESSVMDTEK